MRGFIFLYITILLSVSAGANELSNVYHAEETDEHLLSYAEEEALDQEIGIFSGSEFFNIFGARARFAQTRWEECSGKIKGNYSGHSCTDRRRMSVILKSFLNNHLLKCANQGLSKIRKSGRVRRMYIEHVGITGDRRHSPRSLHAESRAIDVKRFRLKLTNGRTVTTTYAAGVRRPFFEAFRRCWGGVLKRYNDCPYYQGQRLLTGSIGREDSRHRKHMHLSVPYCIRGRYGRGYFNR